MRSQWRTFCFALLTMEKGRNGPRASITSVDHKGVTCYGLRGRGVESCSLMTSVETRDLSGKVDRFRVNSNTKRVGKSRHVEGGMFTTVAILNEKIHLLHGSAGSFFDPTWPLNAPTSETRLQLLHDDAHRAYFPSTMLLDCVAMTQFSFNTRQQAPSMRNERSRTHVARDLKPQAQASFAVCGNYRGSSVIRPWPTARCLHGVIPTV